MKFHRPRLILLLLEAVKYRFGPLVCAALLTACSESELERLRDPALIARGGALYAEHCAQCHGEQAQATPEWRRRDAEGFFPPPPLDDSAHAWHHPLADLRRTIREGSPPGLGRMPAWKEQLTDAEIDAIIAWFQSLWSAEAYAAWREIDQRARQQR